MLSLIGLLTVLTVILVLIFSLLADADLTTILSERFGADVGGELGGKVVWVTGASTGIGEALALQSAKHGARLIISARTKSGTLLLSLAANTSIDWLLWNRNTNQ